MLPLSLTKERGNDCNILHLRGEVIQSSPPPPGSSWKNLPFGRENTYRTIPALPLGSRKTDRFYGFTDEKDGLPKQTSALPVSQADESIRDDYEIEITIGSFYSSLSGTEEYDPLDPHPVGFELLSKLPNHL